MGAPIQTTEEQLYHFVDDLEKSLSYEMNLGRTYENVIMCGMGGSAISADIVYDLCFADSDIPLKVLKYPVMPKWSDSDTLAICSSYSGNTQETIAAYLQAKSLGCKTVVITSGGNLKRMAEENSDTLVLMPENMHPRHSIGFMIGYTLAAIIAAGGPDIRYRLTECIPSLKKYRDEIKEKYTGTAWKLAESFVGNLPIMLSDASLKSIALRWKTQINENAKCVAFTNQSQEFNGCATGAWNKCCADNRQLVVLCESKDAEINRDANALEKDGCKYRMLCFDGISVTDNMFRALILGDYISMYMAEIRGINSGTVPPIDRLKVKLRERIQEYDAKSTDKPIEFSVCICAYNEADNIGRCIESVYNQKFDGFCMKEVIVVSSNSDDGTDDIVRDLTKKHETLKLIAQPERKGKNHAINEFLDTKKTKIVVILNADNILCTENSLQKLVEPFRDPKIGIVGGHPIALNDGKTVASFASKMEWIVHHRMAMITPKIGELVAYRDLGFRLPTDTQNDEELMRMKIESKHYLPAYAPEATTYNRGPETREDFIKQRVRTNIGQCYLESLPEYYNPSRDNSVLIKATIKALPELGFHPIKIIQTARLELYCRKKARKYVEENKHDTPIWERVDSTKKL